MGAEDGSNSLMPEMKEICIASNNAHKLKEIKEILGESYQLLSLSDIGCTDDIPETQPTIEGNSLQKAQYIWDHYKINCLADDTGLLVDSLDGEPGVISARYAGDHRSGEDNIALLLSKLDGNPQRNAHFKTVMTFIDAGSIYQFEGKVFGEITAQVTGAGGFGYDPVFLPEGKTLTFAEMGSKEKNAISHRGRALANFAAFLKFQQMSASLK
ncbi:MAG: RdgB/HAM1 family non-canonical purine NTP pyrophosphatase [Imperialibacter sp.]|uniref:RdgB/HAM1 family non-canonical purine NTP pyrophosphatase n=1 Tax=Imperialibacter sp. TaxID=2038411 RepID=UPI0032EE0019